MNLSFELLLTRWKMAVVAALGLALCGWTGRAIYREAKVWRAHELAAVASSAKGQPDATIDAKLHAAYQLEPYDPVVVRACARYEFAIGDPAGVALYRRLVTLSRTTKDDQREAAKVLIQVGDEWAGPLVEKLVARSPGAEDLALAAQYHWRQQEKAMAIDLMRRSVGLDPKDRPHQLLLAQMLALSQDEKEQTEAIHLLQDLAGTQDATGLQALVTLSRNRKLDAVTQRNVLRQLREHPLLDDEARFAGWDLEARLGDREAKVVLQEAVDFFKTTDLPRRTSAARWMLYNEAQPALALELTPASDTAASQELLLTRLDALGDLHQWAEVDRELSAPMVPLPEAMADVYQARAAQQSGHPTLSPYFWDRARRAAADDSAMLIKLSDFALKQGLYDEAKKTDTQLAGIPSQVRIAYAALLQLELQHGTQPELLATLKDMMTDLPSDPKPQNDWALLSLLLNTNVNDACETAQRLVQAHPEMLAYRSTLALGYVRRNDSSDAEKLYNGLAFDWETTPDSWKLIRVIVWAADGQPGLARAYADKIDRFHLRPEEQALFNLYLPDQVKS